MGIPLAAVCCSILIRDPCGCLTCNATPKSSETNDTTEAVWTPWSILQAGLGTAACMTILAFLAVADLLLFHAILCYKGMTTYDYVLANREHGTSSQIERLMTCLTCMCCQNSRSVSINPCQAACTSRGEALAARRRRFLQLLGKSSAIAPAEVAHRQACPSPGDCEAVASVDLAGLREGVAASGMPEIR